MNFWELVPERASASTSSKNEFLAYGQASKDASALLKNEYTEKQLQLMQIEIKSLANNEFLADGQASKDASALLKNDYARVAKLIYDNWYKVDVNMFNEEHFNAWLYFPEQPNRYIPDDYERAYYILSKHNINEAIIIAVTDIMNDNTYAMLYSYLQLCNICININSNINSNIDYHLLYHGGLILKML